MHTSELALGLTRSTDELGRALQSFEELLAELNGMLDRSSLDRLEAEFPKLILAGRELYTARQWVDFHSRTMADKVRFLEGEVGRTRWYDIPTLWIGAVVRRGQLRAKMRSYQSELTGFASTLADLQEREDSTQRRVLELHRRVEDARRAEEARRSAEYKERASRGERPRDRAKNYGPVLVRVGLGLLLAVLGVPVVTV